MDLWEIVNEGTACGCAMVQMVFDGGMISCYGVDGIMPISMEVQ